MHTQTANSAGAATGRSLDQSLDPWVLGILADPISKLPATPGQVGFAGAVVDARRYLPHTPGFGGWHEGQEFYEDWTDTQNSDLAMLQAEIDGVRPVYEHLKMSGRVLDVGGGAGLVREHLPKDVEFVSVDPFVEIVARSNVGRRAEVYTCLREHLNFIAACAEFLPFQAGTFDWVHMRSMLDHVQSTDLALYEARRVLKPGGKLVIGLWVKGGRSGRMHLQPKALAKEFVRTALGMIGIDRYRDHHIFHPTFDELCAVLKESGFDIVDAYWQPQWKDQVCYVTATPATK